MHHMLPDGLPLDDISEIAALLARSYVRLRKSRSLAVSEAAPPAEPVSETGLASLPDQSVHVSGG
jgi:hypothetical protein